MTLLVRIVRPSAAHGSCNSDIIYPFLSQVLLLEQLVADVQFVSYAQRFVHWYDDGAAVLTSANALKLKFQTPA